MQEICQSGSEGGAKPTFVPTPIATPNEPSRRVRCDPCMCTHRIDRNAFGADMSGIATQVGTIPTCLGGVSDHVHLCISQLQETVHSASSSSNKIGPLKKSI
jgi:hypothetical protein